ncbi:MAG: RNA polymerase subunit sigma-70 [Rhizobiales bacterium]|nr:RNA polymerase subunit sigma-70 [Rhizobacter sp.]
MNAVDSAVDTAARVAREAYGRLVAALSVRFRDVAAAEDALGDAFAEALTRWPEAGVPASPEAWLLTVAKNQIRQRARHRTVTSNPRVIGALEQALVELSEQPPEKSDVRLRLLLVCAHPAIDETVRTPLMLQSVLGLDAARIARAFLVKPAAMGQRLVRAKQKIRDAGIPFDEPEPAERPQRMAAVREAIYAAFGADYDDYDGERCVESLAEEALYLSRILTEVAPDDAESLGLYALLCFSHARRAARTEPDGTFVPLVKQNVARWDRAAILEGNAVLLRASTFRVPGPFQLEAAIQSAHCQRLFSGHIPWKAIEYLYATLNANWPTIASAVAHAAVLVEIGRVADAQLLLGRIERARIAEYAPYWVVLSYACQRSGDDAGAREAMTKAIALTRTPRLRTFLEATLAGFGA